MIEHNDARCTCSVAWTRFSTAVTKMAHTAQINSHLFKQPFNFCVIYAGNASFVVEVLLSAGVTDELESVLVKGVFIFMAGYVFNNNID